MKLFIALLFCMAAINVALSAPQETSPTTKPPTGLPTKPPTGDKGKESKDQVVKEVQAAVDKVKLALGGDKDAIKKAGELGDQLIKLLKSGAEPTKGTPTKPTLPTKPIKPSTPTKTTPKPAGGAWITQHIFNIFVLQNQLKSFFNKKILIFYFNWYDY